MQEEYRKLVNEYCEAIRAEEYEKGEEIKKQLDNLYTSIERRKFI